MPYFLRNLPDAEALNRRAAINIQYTFIILYSVYDCLVEPPVLLLTNDIILTFVSLTHEIVNVTPQRVGSFIFSVL